MKINPFFSYWNIIIKRREFTFKWHCYKYLKISYKIWQPPCINTNKWNKK